MSTNIEYLDEETGDVKPSGGGGINSNDVFYFFVLVIGLYTVDLWIRTGDMLLTKFVLFTR